MVDADLAAALVLRWRGCSVHLRAGALCYLRRRDADAAGGGVDEHALSRLHRAVSDQRGPRGDVVDGDRRPLLEGERVGERHDVARGDGDLGRVAAEFGAREDALPGHQPVHALAELQHGPGDFVADHARRLGGVGVQPHARHHVGEVDSRRGDVDPHLPGPDRRVRPLLHREHTRRPVFGYHDRAHAREPI